VCVRLLSNYTEVCLEVKPHLSFGLAVLPSTPPPLQVLFTHVPNADSVYIQLPRLV
jgi:hypothetical protein